MMKVEITEWWDFKRRLIAEAELREMELVYREPITVHITTRLRQETTLYYRIANILSCQLKDSILYTVIGSVFDVEKLRKEVRELGLSVSPDARPFDYAYAYGTHLRRAVIRELANIAKKRTGVPIRVVNGFYGNPLWLKELMAWV